MASQKSDRRPPKIAEHWTASLHVFVLVGFAVAQPLFDLLARNAEFFIFQNAASEDIAALVVILSLLLPLGVIGVEGIIGLFSHRLRRWVHGAAIAAGVAATVLPALHPISALPGPLLVAGALLLGAGAALCYACFLPVRQFFSLLSPAVLIFPGLFVFASPVFRIVFPADASFAVERVQIPNSPPIVFIILDEFPLTSLLNEHHQIDAIRYPNFAALARNATWFRNTTTVSSSTAQAVPAILTGKHPETERLPHAADHPHNLFSLLAGTYDLNTFGALTQLCPAHLCTQVEGSVWQRLPSLLSDLAIVYLHLLLPPDLRTTLPTISQNWMHFANAPDPHDRKAAQSKLFDKMMRQTLLTDRRQQGLDFIQAIQATDQPSLYFLHLLLPHGPYHYLPSGKVYSQEGGVPGLVGQRYVDDTWGVFQLYQRHLLQVGFMDTWLGELLTHLRETGLYDQTLLVVTADHGVSFLPNDLRRLPTQTTFQDILPVPLFIKAPSQQHGSVNDRPIETIDILPTLTDILGMELPWEIDGCSALGPCSERIRRIYSSPGKPLTFDSLAEGLERAVQRQHRLFGSGLPFPATPGPYPQLLGKRLEEFGSIRETNVQIKIDRPDRFTAVDLQSDFVPAYITGSIFPPLHSGQPFSLAVAVNDTIHAVTQPWSVPIQGRHGVWSAVVPEAAFQTGQNTVEVFVVSEVSGQATLARATGVHYRLDQTEVMVAPDGSPIPIVPHALRGYIETPQVSENTVLLKGWAVDEKHAQPAERILIFLNGTFYHAGLTGLSRPGIAEWLGQPAFATSGFRYIFPAEPFVGSGTPEVRAFALSGGIASELRYIEGYPWRRSAQR